MTAIRIDLVSEARSLTSGRILCDCADFFISRFFFSYSFIHRLRSPLLERSVESLRTQPGLRLLERKCLS